VDSVTKEEMVRLESRIYEEIAAVAERSGYYEMAKKLRAKAQTLLLTIPGGGG